MDAGEGGGMIQMSLLDDQTAYPCAPGMKARDTSSDAAEQIAPRAKRLRESVHALFVAGLKFTADECAEAVGENILSIRPRLSELAARGLIVDSGRRRSNASGKSAIVWKLAPHK
jgi:hypothetical protein